MDTMPAGRRPLRFVVIGAGMAGILAAIRLKEAGLGDVTVYEKAAKVGGTWRENTYPGLTCDVPSHAYTYSFAPNADWTRHLPPGGEIFDYFEDVTRRHGIMDLIRFNQEIVRCEFGAGRWELETKAGDIDHADFVIAATGVLHHPSYPAIEGLDSFRGTLFHSARWDHSVPLDGRRIGIVGNGSTGVQIVSALAGRAGKLKHFQRTAQWIQKVNNDFFTEEQKAAFRADPELLRYMQNEPNYLAAVKNFTDAVVDAESAGIKAIEAGCLRNLEESVRDPVLREKLRPNYRAVCKRLVSSPDYYEAIQHPNAELVTERILRVEPDGVRTDDGRLHDLDLLVLATGFKADRFMRPMNVVGRGGVRLNDIWSLRPTAYLAISLPDFPNLFMLNGPTGPVGNFSLIDIAERQMNYVLQLIALVDAGECSAVSVTPSAMADYEIRRIKAAKNTVWASGCRSWYLDAEGIPASWPWTYDAFAEAMSKPDRAAYDLAG
jgi:cation diffusion facilitator CzcD-associated flavoprotein CzcO